MAKSTDPAEIMNRWMAEVWNQGNEATIDELMHPQCVAFGLKDEHGNHLVGPAGFRVFYERFRSSFSDIHIHVEDAFSSGNKAAIRFTFTARHTGDGLAIARTNKSIRATGMCIAHLENGQLRHAWNEFDMHTLISQITS